MSLPLFKFVVWGLDEHAPRVVAITDAKFCLFPSFKENLIWETLFFSAVRLQLHISDRYLKSVYSYLTQR